ncbi:YkgJ family cysteine cluster protein [Thermogladius sp. 4427co]|uniref:YkgJ family cysteine cluster protein n=1 Tax=Thermogladius sp. 4427co TaxID=3450718 RepID=UPI003F79C27C
MRFKCTLCGECCKASPVSLLPHEDVILRELAERMGLVYKSYPGYSMYDRVSGYNLAFSYVMDLIDGKCTFLSGNLCMIHNIYKPLICRSFPYIPRQVRYNIDSYNRVVYATAEYGLSLVCPVIKDDKRMLEKMLETNPGFLAEYMPSEYDAAGEMERIRSLMLTLLSTLWRLGIVDLESHRPGAPVYNLYLFLVKHYPDLPHILRIDQVMKKAEELVAHE